MRYPIKIPYILISIIPPPPRSTLFPYTTLFRSLRNEFSLCIKNLDTPVMGIGDIYTIAFGVDGHRGGFVKLRSCICRDRKSTRLNSSHSQISYAVFCLKKKRVLYRGQVSGGGWS